MQLRDYQKESHDRVWEEWERVDKTLLVLPTGCHALGERLLMANGEIKAVENIEVGDQLMGPDGTSRTVLYRQEGTDTLYKIIPVKGEPFIVTGDHKLSLVRTKEKSRNLYPSDRLAGQIVDVTVEDWLKWSKWKKHIHKLFRAEKIENFKGPSKDLTIDPYFLGVILGDACLQYEISLTTMDSVIVEEIENQCTKYGLKYRTEPAGKALSYYLSADKSKEKRNKLLDDLADLKLRGCDSYTKFVPFNYKTSSLRDRLELIAGLIDSDGSNNNNGFDFISASKQLAEDLAFMCRSVGLAAYVKECKKSCKDFTGTYFRVSISGNTDIVPCRVAHKKARERLQVKNVLRTGFKVEKLDAGAYVGFTVDKDNRYLLDDFTVTHNCGKTIVFSKIIETAVKQGKRVLILAHRDELLEQARDKLERVSGLKCSIEKADESCLDSFYRVTTGSIQTLAREKRLKKFSKDHWDIIVVDEAHHVLSESYKRVIDYFDTAKLLGVTATPDRGDLRNLGEVFESLAYEYKLSKAIKDGYLVPIKAMTIPLEIDLTKVKQQTGDFSTKELGTVLDPYLDAIADEMVKVAKDRKTVVFLPLIETSKKFVRILNSKGFNATEVNGESKDRDKKLRDFDSGKYDVLCNSLLLTEGWDCPSVDCVIVLRPTKVRALYAQMVGRGLRLAPNKYDLLVLDFLWHSEKHRLIHPANLVAQNEQVADKMTEILVGKDDYEVMELEELLEEAESSVIEEREEALADELKEMKKRKRKLVDPLQFEMSIKAEDLANYVPAFGWEMGPPTEKQIKVLEQNGIYPDEIENAGKANLILDRLNARKIEGLATPKQIRFLEKRGFNHVGQWKFDSANSMISRIAANNWRNPRGVTPSTYKPDELTK